MLQVMAGPNIIISGAPASGKGTQCEFIVEKFGVVHISTGDALRDQVKKGTELGNMAKSFMDKGALVPDDVMIGIVRDRLAAEDCKEKGWLLDGFPRTGVQAEAMAQEGIVAEKFVLLNVPDDVLIERCVGRRSDPITGKIYHLKFNPPPNDPEVLGRLVHRNDDTAEAMRSRIKMYNSNVEAIKGYYKPITTEFDGVGDKMQLAAKIADFIAKVLFLLPMWCILTLASVDPDLTPNARTVDTDHDRLGRSIGRPECYTGTGSIGQGVDRRERHYRVKA